MDFFAPEHQNTLSELTDKIFDVEYWQDKASQRFPDPAAALSWIDRHMRIHPETSEMAGSRISETPADVYTEMYQVEFLSTLLLSRATDGATQMWDAMTRHDQGGAAMVAWSIRHAVPYWIEGSIWDQVVSAAKDEITPPRPDPWPFPLLYLTSERILFRMGAKNGDEIKINALLLMQDPMKGTSGMDIDFAAVAVGEDQRDMPHFLAIPSSHDSVIPLATRHFLHFVQGAIFRPQKRMISQAMAQKRTRYRRPVQWIDLRRVESRSMKAALDRESASIDWRYRWAVMGHWREQACGQKHSERKPVWIEPYVKGPTDKPIKPKAYRVIR